MIKFFRKIRQQLLTENKFSQYLIYAIGEIVLVVIGILIALSINTRNQNIKDIKSLEGYYDRLILDLHNDLNEIDLVFDNINNLDEIKLELKRINQKNYNTDSLINGYSNWLRYTREFTPNNSTYIELLSTGNLSLISNNNIKNPLLNIYNITYPEFEFFQTNQNAIVTQIRLETYYKNLSFVDMYNNDYLSGLTFSHQRPTLNIDWLTDKKSKEFLEFENSLAATYASHLGIHNRLEDIKRELKNLISEIQKELHNK